MTTPPTSPSPQSPLINVPCLEGQVIAFTGTLASMTHEQAAELARGHGGEPQEHVSRATTILVVGDEGWPLEDNGQPSVKFEQAERLRAEGEELRILTETEWLRLLGETSDAEEARQLYTPAMLSQLLGLRAGVIRTWERLGLIRPVKRVYRLPYFDFQEVTSVRRLSELLQAGVTRKDLETALRRLPSVERGDHRPLEQLQILAQNARIVVRDRFGLVDPVRGQRVFDFGTQTPPDAAEDLPAETATIRFEPHREVAETNRVRDWFVAGCRLYDDGRVAEAVEAFRMELMGRPDGPETHFHLADCLYRLDNVRGALERYYVAVEHDHQYVEAWTQIGCLHRELNELQQALVAFEIALDVHAEYPDVHFHKAETLADLGLTDEAIPHWESYLGFHTRGPSADIARQRLAVHAPDSAALRGG